MNILDMGSRFTSGWCFPVKFIIARAQNDNLEKGHGICSYTTGFNVVKNVTYGLPVMSG